MLGILQSILEERSSESVQSAQEDDAAEEEGAAGRGGRSEPEIVFPFPVLDQIQEISTTFHEPSNKKPGEIQMASSQPQQSPSLCERLDQYLCKFSQDELNQLITLLKDWNTNAKNTLVVTAVLSSLLRVVGIHKLNSISAFKQHLEGILAYSERHLQRVTRQFQATFLVDFFSAMTSSSEQTSGAAGQQSNSAVKKRVDAVVQATPSKKRKVPPVLFLEDDSKSAKLTQQGEDDE